MNELRKDPLLNRWVAVMKDSKPLDYYLSQGCDNRDDSASLKSCPLCAGREDETPAEIFSIRLDNSPPNSPGWSTRVIPWTGYVFQVEGELGRKAVGMYDRMNSVGANEIIIETPGHNEQDIAPKQMALVLRTYKSRMLDLERDYRLRFSFLYKDTEPFSPEVAGHEHSRVLSPPVIPKGIKDELEGAKLFFYYKERCIFCDILLEELNVGKRIIMETKDFAAFIPYAPKSPFECCIIPKRHECSYQQISDSELDDLSMILSSVIKKLKKAFGNLSYYYFIHTAPNRMPRKDYWHTIGDDYHWHIEIFPRVIKPTGFEIESDFYVLHTSPEDAAKFIQEVR